MKNQLKYIFTITTACLLGWQLLSPVHAESSTKPVVATSESAKVSVNKGDAKSLMQINGMSAYKAHAIIAYRNKNGAFKAASDLEKVNGFKRLKPEALKAITDHLVID